MNDSEGGKTGEKTSRIKDVAGSAESQSDADGLMHHVLKAIGKIGSSVDTDAITGRFKEVTGQADSKIDGGKLRQWAAGVDEDKLKGLLDEARHLGAGAVSLIGTEGEKLAERTPGAFDKLAGTAKERLGRLAGDEGLINEGQLERFKGQFKVTIASVSEMAESRSKDAAETIKAKLDEETRRG